MVMRLISVDIFNLLQIVRLYISPDKPLSCGARVWIETDSQYVTIDGKKLEQAGA